jgi:Arc/MetJ-type ribon-helix-helix transcriptional regulator
MRTRYPSVSEAAQQVLRDIEAEEQIKTAERRVLRSVASGVTSEEATGLLKLAAQCRNVDIDNPEVSYDDLRNFMARCNG